MFSRQTRRPQCCSFCREPGHKINKCVNNVFRQMNRDFRNIVFYSMLIYPQCPMVDFYKNLQYFENQYPATYKKFLMNRGFRLKDLKNNNINHIMIKYYFMPENTEIEFYFEFHKQLQTFYTIRYAMILQETEQEINNQVIVKPIINVIQLITDDSEEDKFFEPCCVCLNDDLTKKSIATLNCGHELCKECCKVLIRNINTCVCPLCRAQINDVTVASKEIVDELKEVLK